MKATIVVLPGDGIGPEVTAEALRVLDVVARKGGHEFRTVERLMGGCSIDAHGVALTDEVLRDCQHREEVPTDAVRTRYIVEFRKDLKLGLTCLQDANELLHP